MSLQEIGYQLPASVGRNDINCEYIFMFQMKNIARKGLILRLTTQVGLNTFSVVEALSQIISN